MFRFEGLARNFEKFSLYVIIYNSSCQRFRGNRSIFQSYRDVSESGQCRVEENMETIGSLMMTS
jgi:hypothetical protein